MFLFWWVDEVELGKLISLDLVCEITTY